MEKLLIVNEVLQWCAVLVIVLWLIFTAAVYRRVFDMQDAEMKKLQRLAEMAGRRDDRAAWHRFDDMARRAMAEKREGRRE